MFIIVTAMIAIFSVALAFYALKRQGSPKELKKVKGELSKKRVIYQRDSSV